ncbi:MAG: cadherin domain-containing protein, partial [Cyclobacteriaceae bacterium]
MKQNYFRSRLGFKNAGKLIALLLHLRKTSKVMALASVVCFTLVHNTYSQSISYVQLVDLASSGATVDGSPVGFTENPYAMAFSADGTKFYLGISNAVRQYTVGAPFDITASLTYDEVYLNTFSQVRDVRGITFSNDGMKLFVTGQFYDDVSQYSLSTAFDLSTASHEGTMQTLNISQACDVDFNNDGTKMYILGRSRERVNQYSLSTPFDITTGVTVDQYYDLPASISSSWALEFDPYGNKMYIMDNVDNKILQFDLTTPFDVSSGVTYEAEALDISNEEDGPLDINISPDGSLFHVVGWGPSGVNEEINQYQINSGPDFFETDANLGSVEGAVRIEIVGDLFTNAGGSFEHKSQYQLSSYPSGLIPNLNISADGTYATFTFTGIATNHQDINDVAQLTFTFVDGAFNSGNAASVENSNVADSDFGIDFEDNPTLSFSGPGFTETTENLGAVEGSLTVEIEGETFASSGQELTITTDYNIANVPDGLIPHLTVAGDGLSAVLTFTGESSMHQNTDDVSDIQFSFTNAAFQGGSAEVVIDADGASSNIGIDFNDNSPVLTHGYPYQIDNLTSKGSFVSTNEEDTPQGVTFNATGTKMYIVGASSQSIHQYSLTQPYNITWGVTYDNVSFDVSNEDTDPRDIMFNSTGTKMYMLGLGTQGFYQYSLTTPYDVSTMSPEGSLIIGLGFPMGFTFDETGNTLIIALAGVLRQYSLTTAFDVTGTVNLEGSISILSTTDRIHGLEFDADGSSLFLINYKNKTVSKYSLTTPYDVLSGHTLAESFYLGNIDSQTLGMAMNEFGTRMFFVGQISEAVIQLDMDAGGFVENPANDGSVTGEIVMQLYDDQFTNAGGTFIGGVEYIITNLPSGLSPLFSISADGSTATLTFSGNANSHSNNDDVQSLNISFLDAAFEIGDRDIVANNGNIEHGLGVDFGDGPVVTDETFTVLEGSPNFTVVGTVSATNPNMGTFSYSITAGNNLGKFFVQTDGDIVVAGDIDYDVSPTFSLTIEVSDGSYIGSGTFTIEVEERDETAPSPLSFSPADEAINVSPSADLVITFDEEVESTGQVRYARVKRKSNDEILMSMAMHDPAVTDVSG